MDEVRAGDGPPRGREHRESQDTEDRALPHRAPAREAGLAAAAPIPAPTSAPAASPTSASSRVPALLGAVLALAVAVRVVAAVQKSLVLDEFHTWFHATRPSVEAFFETLALDNHPPLGFALVALARLALGTGELALRTPALVAGTLELGLVAWLGTRHLGRRVGLAATALLAASSLHVDFSSQARMYALHALSATVTLSATHALLTRERARGAAVALAASLATAFHTHYFGGHYVLCLALAALALAALEPQLRPRLARFAAPVFVATLVSLPWALTGFRAQLAHRLPPGGDDLGLAGLAEAFVHLFFLNVRLGGNALRVAFIGGGGLALVLGAVGALMLVSDRQRRVLGVLLATAAFVVPIESWVVANLAPRMGFTWHYLLPSAAALALLAAHGAWGRAGAAPGSSPGPPSASSRAAWRTLRKVAWATTLSLATLLSLLNAASRGTEDFRGAVTDLLARYEPGDAVISVEWQPPLFPMGQPYDYYAPRVHPNPPARLRCEEYTLVDPRDLDGHPRVLMIHKSLPPGQHLMQLLREHYELVESRTFGFALEVLVWRRR